MHLFMSSTLCFSYHPTSVIEIAKEKGFTGIEFWAEHLYCFNADPSQIRSLAEKAGLDITVHSSSWDLNIASMNKGIRNQSVSEIKKSIEMTAMLNAISMTFHPGSLTLADHMIDQHRRILVDSTKELLDYAEKFDVAISMELMEDRPKEFITTPESMNDFLSILKSDLGTTVDIAHVPINKDPCHYLAETFSIKSIHLSDSSFSTYHVPLGKGSIDLDDALSVLISSDLPVVLEGMDFKKELTFLDQHIDYLKKNGYWARREMHENTAHQR